jgi:rubrerythrin
MPDATLKEILQLCLSVENSIAEIYRSISVQAGSDEYRAFWEDISKDEVKHVKYWKELLLQEGEGKLRTVFDPADETITELEALRQRVKDILSEERDFSDVSAAILLAFRLEYLMLHPVFAILFRQLGEETGGESPAKEYQEHINKFHGFVKKYLPENQAVELIGLILSNMWKHNRALASQFLQIKTLRGLIPICASCKKIRNDKGYWDEIESYMIEHADARFSHGICPECIKKLYPKVDGEKTN